MPDGSSDIKWSELNADNDSHNNSSSDTICAGDSAVPDYGNDLQQKLPGILAAVCDCRDLCIRCCVCIHALRYEQNKDGKSHRGAEGRKLA